MAQQQQQQQQQQQRMLQASRTARRGGTPGGAALLPWASVTTSQQEASQQNRFVLEPPSWLSFPRFGAQQQFASQGPAIPFLDASSSSASSTTSSNTASNPQATAAPGPGPAGPQQQQHQEAVWASTTLAQHPELGTFSSGATGHGHAAAVQHCLSSMRASTGPVGATHHAPLWHVLNAVLPLLGHVAAAQHHMVQQLRSFRPRNPFGGRGGGHGHGHGGRHGEHAHYPEGTSCALMTHGPRPASRQAQRYFEQGRALEKAQDPLGAARAFALAFQASPFSGLPPSWAPAVGVQGWQRCVLPVLGGCA